MRSGTRRPSCAQQIRESRRAAPEIPSQADIAIDQGTAIGPGPATVELKEFAGLAADGTFASDKQNATLTGLMQPMWRSMREPGTSR